MVLREMRRLSKNEGPGADILFHIIRYRKAMLYMITESTFKVLLYSSLLAIFSLTFAHSDTIRRDICKKIDLHFIRSVIMLTFNLYYGKRLCYYFGVNKVCNYSEVKSRIQNIPSSKRNETTNEYTWH